MSMFNLKVKPTNSKLNKLHLIEYIDNDILNALINSSLLSEEFHNKLFLLFTQMKENNY